MEFSGGAPSTVKHFRSEIRRISLRKCLTANSEFPGFVRLEIPKPWKINQIPSPEELKNCASLSRVGTVSFFGGVPSMKQSELVMKFLTVRGALPKKEGGPPRSLKWRVLYEHFSKRLGTRDRFRLDKGYWSLSNTTIALKALTSSNKEVTIRNKNSRKASADSAEQKSEYWFWPVLRRGASTSSGKTSVSHCWISRFCLCALAACRTCSMD